MGSIERSGLLNVVGSIGAGPPGPRPDPDPNRRSSGALNNLVTIS